MGFGGMSVGSLLLILLIVLLIFGTKKIRNIGNDLGGAVKGFRSAMNEGEKKDDEERGKLESNEGESASAQQAQRETKEHHSS